MCTLRAATHDAIATRVALASGPDWRSEPWPKNADLAKRTKNVPLDPLPRPLGSSITPLRSVRGSFSNPEDHRAPCQDAPALQLCCSMRTILTRAGTSRRLCVYARNDYVVTYAWARMRSVWFERQRHAFCPAPIFKEVKPISWHFTFLPLKIGLSTLFLSTWICCENRRHYMAFTNPEQDGRQVSSIVSEQNDDSEGMSSCRSK